MEYIAQIKTVYKAIWIRGPLRELNIFETILEKGYSKIISSPNTIFADNQRAVKLTKNPKYPQKTKHIPIKYPKTRELMAKEVINFELILNEMVADGFIKLLGIWKFKEFVEMLGIVDCQITARLMRRCYELILIW